MQVLKQNYAAMKRRQPGEVEKQVCWSPLHHYGHFHHHIGHQTHYHHPMMVEAHNHHIVALIHLKNMRTLNDHIINYNIYIYIYITETATIYSNN